VANSQYSSDAKLCIAYSDAAKRPTLEFEMNSYEEAEEALKTIMTYIVGQDNTPPRIPIYGGEAVILFPHGISIVAVWITGEMDE